MSKQQEGKGLDLRDPLTVIALENIVFNGTSQGMPADKWLASLALLLVAKSDDEQAIEMNVNGIRVSMTLLPPEEGSPMEAGDDEDEDDDEEEDGTESITDVVLDLKPEPAEGEEYV